jgi:hypothetical protein
MTLAAGALRARFHRATPSDISESISFAKKRKRRNECEIALLSIHRRNARAESYLTPRIDPGCGTADTAGGEEFR